MDSPTPGMDSPTPGVNSGRRQRGAAGAVAIARPAGRVTAARDAAAPQVPERVIALSPASPRRGLPVLQRVHSSPIGSPTPPGSAAASAGQAPHAVSSSASSWLSGTTGTPPPANGVLPPTIHHNAAELPLHPTGLPMAPAPAAHPRIPISRDNGLAAVQRTPVSRDNGVRPAQRTVQRTPSGGSEPASAAPAKRDKNTAPGQRELDELARRLYGPISRRLRAELRADRERSGRFTGRSSSGR